MLIHAVLSLLLRVPVFALHVGLWKMTSLRFLRVFEAQRAIFVDPHGMGFFLSLCSHPPSVRTTSSWFLPPFPWLGIAGKYLITDIERALLLSDTAHQPPLSTYGPLLPRKTTAMLLTALHCPFIETLRLSGAVRIANTPTTLKNLKHLTVDNVQGSYPDIRDFFRDFPFISTLESFTYSQTD